MTSSNYTTTDVFDELALLVPKETSVDREGSFVIGSEFLRSIRAGIFSLLTSDPDSLLGLIRLAHQRAYFLAKSAVADLTEIRALLSVELTSPSYVSPFKLEDVIKGFEGLNTGPYYHRVRLATRLKEKVKELASLSVRPGSLAAGSKDPAEILSRVTDLLLRVPDKLNTIDKINLNIAGALNNYYDSGLVLDAVSFQADKISARLKDFRGQDGINISRALLAASVGVALLDERLTIRSPLAAKYAGDCTVQAGKPAYVVSTMCLPYSLASIQNVAVTIDTDAGTITVPAAGSAKLVVQPKVHDSSGATLFPIVAPSNFQMLINNDIRHVRETSNITSISELAVKLNTGLSPHGVGVTTDGTLLTFVHTGVVGSQNRIAFCNSGLPAANGEVDLNALLQLTYTKFSDARGTDVSLQKITHSGYAFVPLITSDHTQLVNSPSATLSVASSKSVLTAPTGHLVVAGDKVVVNKFVYTVYSVTTTSITLTVDMPRSFNGTVVGSGTGTVSYVAYRDNLRITGLSTSYPTAGVAPAVNNIGLPVLASTASGSFSGVTLNTAPSLGSPIRSGDYLITSDDTASLVAVVLGSSGSGLTVDFMGSPVPITTNIKIIARGAHSYRLAINTTRDRLLTRERLASLDSLLQKISVYVTSGSSGDSLFSDIDAYISFYNGITSSDYDANMPNGLSSLLKSLSENKLEIIKDLLISLEFRKLATATPEELSEVGNIRRALGEVVQSFGGSDSIQITSDAGVYTDNDASGGLVEFPTVLLEE